MSEACCTLLPETGTRGLPSRLSAVRTLSGGQIQRHLPSNTQCYSKATHTAQVHSVLSVHTLVKDSVHDGHECASCQDFGADL